MKRMIALILALMSIVAAVSGCGGVKKKDNRLSIVTTIYPEYDWVNEIAGDAADITLLLDKGVDMHSYQPSVDDIMKISNADVFIYVGGESDAWVDDALKEAVNKKIRPLCLMDALGDKAKTEEALPGVEKKEKTGEYDEHVWLSLKNAKLFCDAIAETLAAADTANAALYLENADKYISRLEALDKEYADAVKAAEYKTLLFGDRFPFRYLVDDYGLEYYAAFDGCSAETEASFETVAFLARKLDELELPAIIKIDNSDEKLARTIVENTKTKNQKILTLNSMQSTGSADGEGYIEIMQQDLDTLKQALNNGLNGG